MSARTSAYLPSVLPPEGSRSEGKLAQEGTAPTRVVTATVAEPCALLSFFDPDSLSDVYHRSGWTLAREQEILQEIASNEGEAGGVRIAALETMRKHRLEALKISGRLSEVQTRATATETRQETGRTVEIARTTTRQLLEAHALQGPTFDEGDSETGDTADEQEE